MSADFSERRVKMVDGQVRTTDVTNAPLLDAMLSVPREAFVGAGQRDLAYIDEDIRISDGADGGGARYLMEASPLAKLLQLAEIDASDSALDVGCGTGYSTALLSRLARSVVGLESDPALAETAKAALSTQGCDNATVITGPLPIVVCLGPGLLRGYFNRLRRSCRDHCEQRSNRRQFGTQRHDLRNLGGRVPLRQQPHHLAVAPLHHVLRPAKPLLELPDRQLPCAARHVLSPAPEFPETPQTAY